MSEDTTDTDRDTLIDLQPYTDSELDDAMRELEALEAEEKRYSGRVVVRIIALAFLGACMLFQSPASAEPSKAKRPTLCLTGTPVTGAGFAGFLCRDGKRPKLFTRWTRVEFVDSEGEKASYVLGWTTLQPKQPAVRPVGMLKL